MLLADQVRCRQCVQTRQCLQWRALPDTHQSGCPTLKCLTGAQGAGQYRVLGHGVEFDTTAVQR